MVEITFKMYVLPNKVAINLWSYQILAFTIYMIGITISIVDGIL